MSSATDLIAKIDIKIEALLDDSSNVGNYKIGDKRVDKGDFMAHLVKMRESLIKQDQDSTPYEDIREIAFEINEFGEDESEYIGDVSS